MGTMLIDPLIDTVEVSASLLGAWLAINHQNSGVGVDISREIPTLLLFLAVSSADALSDTGNGHCGAQMVVLIPLVAL